MCTGIEKMTVLIYDIATKDRCNLLAMYASGLGKLFPERWKRYDPNYFVSSDGCVCDSQKRLIKHFKAGRGYAFVKIYGQLKKVHQMVLHTFKPNPNPKYYDMCDHINGDRMDPRLENLRWSNVNLNGLNKLATKGYETLKRNGVPTGKFGCRTCVTGRRAWLGTLNSKEECIKTHKEAVERVYEIAEEY